MNRNRFILTLLISLSSIFSSFGQEEFGTYDNSYLQQTFDIEIKIENDGHFTLYIDGFSMDVMSKKGGFLVDGKGYKEFIDNLLIAKAKYTEWVETAKANDIKELNKEIKVNNKSKIQAYFLYGSKWQFDFYVKPTYKFLISEKGDNINYVLLVHTGSLVSSSNQFMKSDGVILAFTSVEEIDDFLAEISVQKMQEFKDKPKKEDLFKD